MDSLRGIRPYVALHLPSAVRDGMQPATRRSVVTTFTVAVRAVADRVGCSLDDATDLMFDRSMTDGSSLGDVAVAVVEGRICFDS